MIKFIEKQNNNKNFLLAIDYNTTTAKNKTLAFCKSLKLKPNTKNLLIKLLKLQKICINNDFNQLLSKINQMLFRINECYRKKVIANAQKVNISWDGYKSFEFITCYRLLNKIDLL
jgi:hypothetical protein